jgi:3-oxoacyl-[acyl-carrier protein] reductase
MDKCLISGGTGTIGQGLVKEFSKDYKVYFTYLRNEKTAGELEIDYGAVGLQCDISNSENVRQLGLQCDLLINNAGISQIKLFTDITDTDWNNMLGVNLTGTFNMCRQFLPYMIRQKNGCIINISSVWGVSGGSCEVHYSAAKAGIIGLTKALAKEVGLSGIRVNAIAPGVIGGGMNARFTAEEMQELRQMSALNKIGAAEDVAKAARYLSEADFVTGEVMAV